MAALPPAGAEGGVPGSLAAWIGARTTAGGVIAADRPATGSFLPGWIRRQHTTKIHEVDPGGGGMVAGVW